MVSNSLAMTSREVGVCVAFAASVTLTLNCVSSFSISLIVESVFFISSSASLEASSICESVAYSYSKRVLVIYIPAPS